jgi:hypothetical protein
VKVYSKEELIAAIQDIFSHGWHKSIKQTVDTRNDGAVGNTLEHLLGIEENNLPIPNAREWELKGQRSETTSLVTLKHSEPSPTALKIVSSILLPNYGWKHKLAGAKYPPSEMSFRATISAINYTSRGFAIVVDRTSKKIRVVFDPNKIDSSNSEILDWLESVKMRIGLGPLTPEPFWGFDDLEPAIALKMKNCFYVIAERKVENSHEWFKYKELYILSGFSFSKFLASIENGTVLVDFDARTHHNHGTKFRMRQGNWANLYETVQRVV